MYRLFLCQIILVLSANRLLLVKGTYVSFSRLILMCFSKPLINFTMSKIILQASIHYQQCVPAVRSEIY